MKPSQANPLSLDKFVDKLLEDKGLSAMDAEVLAQMKSDLLGRIEDRMNAVILEKMPPEKLEYFEKMLDNSEEKDIQEFCSRSIPGLDRILAAELASFRETYLSA